tara:strand:- start:1016 stop:1672 length:657 start_codon:yes stop_codon:yes gene_type:complete
MSFKKKKYAVMKNVISKDLASFLCKYLVLKREVYKTLNNSRYISPYDTDWGCFTDKQVPDTFVMYADVAMETLLGTLRDVMEKETKLKLIPTYSFVRLYKKGDILHRHKDRFSCEISTTLNLGGDPWPIYVEAKKNIGIHDPDKGLYVPTNNKGTKINLEPGDMMLYRGRELEHWRETFEGEECAQVFLHYNEDTKENRKNIFDSRAHLGLPAQLKQK